MATIRLIPSAYTSSNSSYATVYSGEANMYYNTDHTANYASLRGRNQNSTTAYYIFLRGFNFDDVPSNAIVSSFTVKIRCYRNSYQRTGDNYRLRLATTTNINNVVTNSITSTEIGTSVSTITIPTGDLDWDTLNGYGSNFSIVIPLSSTSSSRPYVYVYGAEIEVTYTIPVYHTVSTSSDVSGVTVSPSSASVLEGNSATVEISSNGTTFTVKDNNVDVTNQLVSIPASGSDTEIPNGYTNLSSGVTINSSYPIANAYDNADDSSDYCRLDFNTSTTGYIELLFDLPDLPSSATLTSVTARARLRISSTSRMTNTIVRLYAGSTAKGSNATITSTSSGGSLITLTPGTWTASELSTLRMRIGATSSSSTSSKYVYIYGADVTVNYTLGGEFYTYTINNVTTDHIILITGSGTQPKIFIKKNGTWIQCSKVYKKVNGSWVEQDSSTWTTILSTTDNYRLINLDS